MLTAYFDDSGTHDDSPVVTIGGCIAHSEVWADFEVAWQDLLKKEHISDFHMTDCQAKVKQFEGWNQARVDSVIHDFRKIILDRPIWYIGLSASTKDWQRIVPPRLRSRLGTAEDFCARMAVHDALLFASNSETEEGRLAVVFDHSANKNRGLSQAIDYWFGGNLYESTMNGHVIFAQMKKTPPLQAADMVAWECANHWKACILENKHVGARPHFQRFLENRLFSNGFASSNAIRRIVYVEENFGQIMTALLRNHGKGIDGAEG